MPRYHFHLHDGVDVFDEEGSDLPNIEAARSVAMTYLADVLRDTARKPIGHKEWRVDVTMGDGLLLFALEATSLDAPALGFRSDS